jgi:hypothetical protein
MCAICKRVILERDLRPIGNGLMVCASARWCLIAALHTASEAQIAYLHRNASDLALRSAESVSIPRSSRGGKTHAALKPSAEVELVRLP